MEYDPSNKFEDRASMAIVNRYFSDVPSFTHSVSNGNLTIDFFQIVDIETHTG